jgi:D-glycero-D-manno-heptose 1,7-bisphosphate phosphatase
LNRAVFLDRDGVLNKDTNHVTSPELLPRVAEAIKLLKGFLIVVVTNQAGVAKGYFTEYQVIEANIYIKNALAKQSAYIDKFYYCPHHPEGIVDRYTKKCYCRKPEPGMLKKAELELDIDLSQSFLVGDKLSDIQAGSVAGCRTVLITDGEDTRGADYIAKDLYGAGEWIIKS